MRPDDFGVVAVDPVGQLVGAAWLRCLTAPTPASDMSATMCLSSASAWRSPYRGRGVGRALLRVALEAAQERGRGRSH
jgi:predicted N-acetyltransferase YhbS